LAVSWLAVFDAHDARVFIGSSHGACGLELLDEVGHRLQWAVDAEPRLARDGEWRSRVGDRNGFGGRAFDSNRSGRFRNVFELDLIGDLVFQDVGTYFLPQRGLGIDQEVVVETEDR